MPPQKTDVAPCSGLTTSARRWRSAGGLAAIRLRLIATILSSRVAIQILRHLGLPADPVYPEPAGAPPDSDDIVVDVSA